MKRMYEVDIKIGHNILVLRFLWLECSVYVQPLGVELCQMLRIRIIQHFSKHCSCHVQDECVVVGCLWKCHVGQVVGGK
jgi:hypothetical protein